MNASLALRALWVPVVALLGCAALSGEPACPEGFEAAMRARGVETSCEVLRQPGLLRKQSELALQARDAETAYQYLALIHTLHPESAENREVFPTAAAIFRRYHNHERQQLHLLMRQGLEAETDSPWMTSEPLFLFGWLEQLFQEGEDFPQREVNALFQEMYYGLFRLFLDYAETSPKLSGWVMVADVDSGRVQSVDATRAGSASP
jgi:hypothetical protein